MYLCLCIKYMPFAQGGQKRAFASTEIGITVVGAGNQTKVLWNSSLSCLSNPLHHFWQSLT